MASIAASIGISLAVSAAAAGLTYALTPTQKLNQGRLDSLLSSNSSYGQPIPWAWGTVRLPGNRIWQDYLEETKVKKQQSGKGSKVETTEFNYFGYYASLFCECPFRPVVDFQRIWMNKKLVMSKVGGAQTIAAGGKFADQYLRFYKGDAAQYIDPLLSSTAPISSFSYGLPTQKSERDAFLRSLGIDPATAVLTNAHNYKAYMVAQRLPLGDFFNAIPNTNEAEIIASENCTVGQIIGDIMSLFYSGDRYDVSLLTTPVDGFAIDSVGAALNTIQTLQQAYFFDYVYSNGVYKFIPINSPRDVVNLSSDNLAASISGTKKPLDYEIIEKDPSTLPSKVIVKYIDKDLDYDVNEQCSKAEVKNHYNANPVTLTFNLVMSASVAATIADRAFILAWVQKYLYKFQLPPAYLHLEPADLVPNLFDDRDYPIKITQTRIGANLILDCEGVAHDTYFWNLTRILEQGGVTVGVADYNVVLEVNGQISSVTDTAGNVYSEGTDYTVTEAGIQVLSGGNIPSGSELIISTTTTAQNEDFGSITTAGDTELLVLDIPLIANSEPDYTLYLAAGGGENWDGASIYVSTDNSRYVFVDALSTYSVYGSVVTAFDNDGNITVTVNRPELESITDADLELGFNLALVGNEIIQFKTAQLTDINTYLLSEITRGLRGTEFVSQPQTGDRFVLLRGDNASILKVGYDQSDINQTRYFKAVSSGQSLDEVTPVSLILQGIAQRPYAPINLVATKNAAEDITIEWDRRDRHAQNENPPLSEETEDYQVGIINSASSTIIRTQNTNINSWIYTASDQIADFGSVQSTITVEVAQVSSVYGIGGTIRQELTPLYIEPAPTISSFTPASATIGATITISGTNLAQVQEIKIGDVVQSNLAVSDNQTIEFQIAPGSATNFITVTTSGGTAVSSSYLIVENSSFSTVAQFVSLSASRSIVASDHLKILNCESETELALSLDKTLVLAGFQTTIRKKGTGDIALNLVPDTDVLEAVGNIISVRYTAVYLTYQGDGIWIAIGSLTNSN